MKKVLWTALAVLLALAMLTGCGPAGSTASTAPETSAATTTEMAESPSPEESPSETALRIVSTVPSATEILFALGVGDWIVGVDVSSTYPEAANGIEKVGDYNGFDVEKIISLAPDVVFAGNKLQVDLVQQLEAAGLNVVEADPTLYEDIAACITMIGEAVGRADEAAALNAQIAAVEEAIKTKAAEFTEKPTIYYVMGIGEYGNWTSGEGSFINAVFEMCGATCVTAGSAAPWMDYPPEDLVTADPDILIVSQWVAEDALKADASYASLTAVQQGHCYFINPDIIERPGPRIAEAMQLIQESIITFLGE